MTGHLYLQTFHIYRCPTENIINAFGRKLTSEESVDVLVHISKLERGALSLADFMKHMHDKYNIEVHT